MMDKDADAVPAPGDETPAWLCRNCGHLNPSDHLHCEKCGFHRDYDPELEPEIDFASMQEQIELQQETRRRNLGFYLQAGMAVVQLLTLALVLVMSIFIWRNWPFQQAFEAEAGALADAVLTMQAALEMGLTKGEYEERIIPLIAQKTKFKEKYGKRRERQRQAFQKLVQAAEYYELAREAWEHELAASNSLGRLADQALSINASENVRRYWNNAASNALLAIDDLR
jgi:hypothetical protein